MTLSDEDLLRQFASDSSNVAFTELVRRYLSLVYSAAKRQVQSASLAEDIAQSVFIDLSRNAGKLKPGQPLAAWLYLVTRRTAIDAIRRESRRQSREQSASEIAAMKSNPSPWAQVEPHLDEAMETLNEADRQALLLRYFSSKSLREVGETLGTSEDAAQKRVSRALEHLRAVFARRGIAVTAAGLATDLSAHVVLSVPAGLGTSVVAGAFSATALAQTANTITMTALNKTLVAAAVVLVASLVYETHRLATERSQMAELEQKIAAQQIEAQRMQSERDRAAALLAKGHEELDAARAAANEQAVVESDLEAWLERVNQLKTALERMPDKNIPEMRFLTSHDWLTVTLNNKMQTEAKVRRALSDLRRLAKDKPAITQNFQSALSAYYRDHDRHPATDPAQLRPYLNPPLDDSILQRYEFATNTTTTIGERQPNDGSGQRTFQEKTAVDEDFDQLLTISERGYGFRDASKLGARRVEATEAYLKINGGQGPTTPEQLLPYFTTPMNATELKEFWDANLTLP